MQKTMLRALGVTLFGILVFLAGFFTRQLVKDKPNSLLNPLISLEKTKDTSLLIYSIANLQQHSFSTSPLTIEKEIAKADTFTTYLFSYETLGRKMTGQLNIPLSLDSSLNQKKTAIVLLRGYVPLESYTTGVGTKNAAAVFAQNGYITVAPDFFGYGESDPEPENSWQARFEKPLAAVELIRSLEKYGVPESLEENVEKVSIDTIGMWGHSNGGQIALTTLEILQQEIPTTLWAPVTAPFPYSVLYFSDEYEDEGKATRKWLAEFEETYDAQEFSLTQHLSSLVGPIQIQHGTADDAALIYWSQEFIEKTAALETPVDIKLITYPGADHNLVPNWNAAIQADLAFFKKHL